MAEHRELSIYDRVEHLEKEVRILKGEETEDGHKVKENSEEETSRDE